MDFTDISKSRLTATFRDKALEKAYQTYARQFFTDRDRIMLFSAISIYLLYTLLDFFTLQNARFEIITLRMALFIGACGLIALTYLKFGQRYLQTVCVGLMLIGGVSISFMIWMEGAINPPYYVGLIMVAMILNNMVRIQFKLVVLTLSTWYLSFIVAISGIATGVDMFAAHFFVINSFMLAGIATYFLELGRRDEYLKHAKNVHYAETLKVMVDDANRSIKTKNAVLNALTHVFKTPLHQIIGYAQILEQEALGEHSQPEYKDYSGNIHLAGRNMLRLVQRLLKYSRLDAGAASLTIVRTSTREIVDCALSRLEDAIAEKSLTVIRPETSCALKGDGSLLEEAAFEIIANAINAAPPGTVLTISVHDETDRMTLMIEDEGSGIDLDRLEEIRNTLDRTEEFLGIGEKISLGITLVSKIMQVHNGSLTFAHTAGGGTCARLSMPVERVGQCTEKSDGEQAPAIETAQGPDNRLSA